jgi:hypothetical protein
MIPTDRVENELLGPGVHTKPDGPSMWLWLRWISERVWFRDIPLKWRSIIEP